MNIIQVDLSKKTSIGVKKMTTWVNDRPDLKLGVVITLKNEVGDWTVDRIYNDIHSADEFDWHRKWDNNI